MTTIYNQIQMNIALEDRYELGILLALFDVETDVSEIQKIKQDGIELISSSHFSNDDMIQVLSSKLSVLDMLGFTPATLLEQLENNVIPDFMCKSSAVLTNNGRFIELKLPHVTHSVQTSQSFNNTIINLWKNHATVVEATANHTDLAMFA